MDNQEAAVRAILEEFVQEILELLNKEVPELSETVEEEVKPNTLTTRALLELVYHEGIVREAYKDSRGIWTWGVGVTNKSGHKVYPRYKDNPVPISRVLEVFKWLLETEYLPTVLEVFEGVDLTEEQLASAVSFHYNTGGIAKASWVKSYLVGNVERARREFLNWRSPPEIIPRREAERDLFFDGKWSGDGKATVYKVRKPSYTPDWSSAERIDISKELEN